MIVTGTCELKDEFCPHKEDIPEVSEPDVCKRGQNSSFSSHVPVTIISLFFINSY